MSVTITIESGSLSIGKDGVITIKPQSSPASTPVIDASPKPLRDGSKRARACDVLKEAFAGHSILHRSAVVAAGSKHGIPSGTMADARKHLGVTIKDGHWIWPSH